MPRPPTDCCASGREILSAGLEMSRSCIPYGLFQRPVCPFFAGAFHLAKDIGSPPQASQHRGLEQESRFLRLRSNPEFRPPPRLSPLFRKSSLRGRRIQSPHRCWAMRIVQIARSMRQLLRAAIPRKNESCLPRSKPRRPASSARHRRRFLRLPIADRQIQHVIYLLHRSVHRRPCIVPTRPIAPRSEPLALSENWEGKGVLLAIPPISGMRDRAATAAVEFFRERAPGSRRVSGPCNRSARRPELHFAMLVVAQPPSAPTLQSRARLRPSSNSASFFSSTPQAPQDSDGPQSQFSNCPQIPCERPSATRLQSSFSLAQIREMEFRRKQKSTHSIRSGHSGRAARKSTLAAKRFRSSLPRSFAPPIARRPARAIP